MMNRNKAISELCNEQIKTLSSKDRYEILLSWWGIDEEDAIFHDLSTELQNEIASTEEPLENVMDKRYDQLIIYRRRKCFTAPSRFCEHFYAESATAV